MRRGVATREREAREARERDGALGLDEVEATLWRRGLDAAGVDEVLALVAGLVAATRREAVELGARLGQAGNGARGGERLSWVVGARVEAEPRPGGSARGGTELEPGPEPAAELAGKQAGSGPGTGPGTGSGRLSDTEGVGCQIARAPVSTDPSTGVEAVPVKACGRCGERRPLAEFYRDGNKADGRRGTCKGCEGDRRRVRRRELAAVRWLLSVGADPRELLAVAERRVPVTRSSVAGAVAEVVGAGEATALDLEALADALRGSLEA